MIQHFLVAWATSPWLFLLAFAPVAQAQSSSHRVFDSVPDDSRLRDVHDVDHPTLFVPQFADKAAWERRAKQIREQVLVAEGLWPLPPRTPLNPVIHGKIDRDDYTIEKVFFSSYPGHYVSGNLYRPKNRSGKLPGVLCPHGHWPSGRFYERTEKEAQQQIDKGAEKTMNGARYPLQARCAMLARMGCVVFHYDMVGYADSTAIEHRSGFTDTQAILRLQSFMGLQSWNSIRALDFLHGLPDVDSARIAVTGASGGGTQTLILAADDPRPAVVFPAVMVSEEMQGGCICENAPLLRVGTNNVEIVGTFAPKPLGMSAADDWTHALENIGLPELKKIYGLYGAADQVMAKHFSFEHNYNQVSRELMYNWFNDHLKLGWPSPVKEVPFEPVPPAQLSVYDGAHPRPADTANASILRKYMTQSSDKQLEQLFADDPGQYRGTLMTALQVMANDRLPSIDQVDATHLSSPHEEHGLTIQSGALERRGAGEAIPFVSLTPRDWNGAVVICLDPAGKAAIFTPDGSPKKELQQLLDQKFALLGLDLFLTGEFANAKLPTTAKYEGQTYAGFVYGYNRGVLANRIHDVLTAIAFARGLSGTRQINLLATGSSGPVALLARALAADAVDHAAIDLGGFDFDTISDLLDEMMLPGALKYGGICGFVPLCDGHTTLLVHPPQSPTLHRAKGQRNVTVQEGDTNLQHLIDWLVEAR